MPRPVVSVGNITAGGTGKTPVVRWLCERLLRDGKMPAVLSRGYKTADEPDMLRQVFADRVPVGVNPSRFQGGETVLREHPGVKVFVLDDGFQHRKLQRDFDLVLVNAAEPFGFGHVHPRGLLREPLSGLRRASAILITHADAAEAAVLADIDRTIRRFNASAPIYRCTHEHVGIWAGDQTRPVDWLRDKCVMVVSGIGDPASFEKQIGQRAQVVDAVRRPDHANYSAEDVRRLDEQARQVNADAIVTTGKDWGKMKRAGAEHLRTAVWVVELAIRFSDADEAELLGRIYDAIESAKPIDSIRHPA